LNTPQFTWVKSRLPNKAQPVPPIYEPEVAAEAIYWAAHHSRRELLVGLPTFIAVQGNKLAPGLGDLYLAKTGFKSQQMDVPEDPNRPDNLWEPVDAEHDHGTHGPFDKRAHRSSPYLWETTHWQWVTLAFAGLAGAAAVTLWRRKR
jgi:hypothetical protein